MHIDIEFFTHVAATTWIIGIIVVLGCALGAVELWLHSPKPKQQRKYNAD